MAALDTFICDIKASMDLPPKKLRTDERTHRRMGRLPVGVSPVGVSPDGYRLKYPKPYKSTFWVSYSKSVGSIYLWRVSTQKVFLKT